MIPVAGQVWLDQNGNGLREVGDSPLTGITVTLHSTATAGIGLLQPVTTVLTTTTNVTGYYSFTMVAAGAYYLDFTAPASLAPTRCNQGDNDTIDSDACRVTQSAGAIVGRTAAFTVLPMPVALLWDAGFTTPALVTGRLYRDNNHNQMMEADEPYVAGVRVLLEDVTNVGAATADAPTDVIAQQLTGADGAYIFANLTPGNYRLHLVIPAGLFLPDGNFQQPFHLNPGETSGGDLRLVGLVPTAEQEEQEPQQSKRIYLPLLFRE